MIVLIGLICLVLGLVLGIKIGKSGFSEQIKDIIDLMKIDGAI